MVAQGERKSTPETPGVVIGNHTNKYSAKNPAIRYLTNRWVDVLRRVIDEVAGGPTPPKSPLEVGAGEGVISRLLHDRFGRCVGLDLPDAGLRAEWRARPGPHYVHADAEQLPFADSQFDFVVCVEVLEHVQDPSRALTEIARVGSGDVLLSVPREPIFRGGNLLTGRYVKALGNTPGHVNHWSTPTFVSFVSHVATVRRVFKPLPWTVVWASLD